MSNLHLLCHAFPTNVTANGLTQAMSRSYGVDEDIDMSELDAELDAIDEQLSLEAEVSHDANALELMFSSASMRRHGAPPHCRCACADLRRPLRVWCWLLCSWASQKYPRTLCRTTQQSPPPLYPPSLQPLGSRLMNLVCQSLRLLQQPHETAWLTCWAVGPQTISTRQSGEEAEAIVNLFATRTRPLPRRRLQVCTGLPEFAACLPRSSGMLSPR